jgi:hypothetical protein
MTTKQVAYFGVGFIAGIVVASLFHREGYLDPSTKEALSFPADSAESSTHAPMDYEQQIASLKTQLEVYRTQAELTGGPEGLSSTERAQRLIERGQARFAATQQREVESLLAAGFTMDRINWMRKRAQELASDFRRAESAREQQGAKSNAWLQTSHMNDPDIDMRREIGDEEYAKYRQALGRGLGVRISEVQVGGTGEAGGLRAGDEVIAYNGVRVFNVGELNPEIVKSRASGTSIAVDVIRDGNKIRLSVPAGDMSIKVPPPGIYTVNQERAFGSVEASIMKRAQDEDAAIARGEAL